MAMRSFDRHARKRFCDDCEDVRRLGFDWDTISNITGIPKKQLRVYAQWDKDNFGPPATTIPRPERLGEVRRLWDERLSYLEIATRLKMSASMVSKALRILGITPRKKEARA